MIELLAKNKSFGDGGEIYTGGNILPPLELRGLSFKHSG